MPIAVSGSNIVFADGSSIASGFTGFKNRIINGAMVIDQRNNGASVTYGTGGSTADNYFGYSLDRWLSQSYQSTAGNGGTFTIQRNAGSITPPTSFTNYLGATVTYAQASPAVSSLYQIQTRIEGYNIADLAWGTANAKTVTISFWVYSSLTGQYPLYLNNNNDIAYTTTYIINSANTWEYKTIIIPGPTAGTWNTTNAEGLRVQFTLAASSDRVASTLNSWVASGANSGATGSVNWMATLNNKFYITGVQLEAGSSATSFEYRDYGNELRMCQRYYYKIAEGGSAYTQFGIGRAFSGTEGNGIVQFPVPMRSAPTFAYLGAVGDYDFSPTAINGGAVPASNTHMTVGMTFSSITSGSIFILGANAGASGPAGFTFSAEL